MQRSDEQFDEILAQIRALRDHESQLANRPDYGLWAKLVGMVFALVFGSYVLLQSELAAIGKRVQSLEGRVSAVEGREQGRLER